MPSRILIGAIFALAANACVAGMANAAVINFNGHTTYTSTANEVSEGGMTFTGDEFFFIPPDSMMATPSTFNSPHATPIMATAIEPMTMSLTEGGAFDLQSVKMGLGWWNNPDPNFTDTETLTGAKANCASDCTVTASFTVGYSFQNYVLDDFTGLATVTFGALTPQIAVENDGSLFPYTGWIGYDDITFSAPGVVGEPTGGVPEPSAWALMIVGFGGVGALLRRNRRQGLAAA